MRHIDLRLTPIDATIVLATIALNSRLYACYLFGGYQSKVKDGGWRGMAWAWTSLECDVHIVGWWYLLRGLRRRRIETATMSPAGDSQCAAYMSSLLSRCLHTSQQSVVSDHIQSPQSASAPARRASRLIYDMNRQRSLLCCLQRHCERVVVSSRRHLWIYKQLVTGFAVISRRTLTCSERIVYLILWQVTDLTQLDRTLQP